MQSAWNSEWYMKCTPWTLLPSCYCVFCSLLFTFMNILFMRVRNAVCGHQFPLSRRHRLMSTFSSSLVRAPGNLRMSTSLTFSCWFSLPKNNWIEIFREKKWVFDEVKMSQGSKIFAVHTASEEAGPFWSEVQFFKKASGLRKDGATSTPPPPPPPGSLFAGSHLWGHNPYSWQSTDFGPEKRFLKVICFGISNTF